MEKISPETLKERLKDHALWLGSDGQKGAKAVFSETDLSGLDLSGVNLSEADLLMASLSGTTLSGATLVMVDLSQADMTGADLSGADLSGADLVLADLTGANLSGVDLSVSDLSGATFSQARLFGAKLTQANLSRTNFSKANLLGADLSGGDLTGASFNACDLSGTNLRNTNLSQTDFSKASLLLTSFSGALFRQTRLTDIIIDAFTLSEIPASETKEQEETFRVIKSDKMGSPQIIREIHLPEPFHRAGLSLMTFLCSLIARQHLASNVRLDFNDTVIRLAVYPPNEVAHSEIEALLEVYGRIIQDKLNINALSNNLAEVRRLKGQLVYAQTLLEDDWLLMEERAPAQIDKASGMDWLKTYIGRQLEFADMPADPNHPPSFEKTTFEKTDPLAKFHEHLRVLSPHFPELAYPLSTIQKTFQLKHPNDEIIAEMENALRTIWATSNEMFDDISDAFYDSGLNEKNSEWAEIWYEMIQKLA